MNPWDLSSSDLLVWGIVLHLIADWPLQNEWMAKHKASRWYHLDGEGVLRGERMMPYTPWWIRHPAAYVHAGIHGVLLALIFGWVAIPLAVVHLIIDTRVPVLWWSMKIKQTQPKGNVVNLGYDDFQARPHLEVLYDTGTEVRFWTDQVFHIACLAVASLLVG